MHTLYNIISQYYYGKIKNSLRQCSVRFATQSRGARMHCTSTSYHPQVA